MVFRALKDPRVSKEKKEIAVFQVYLAKKVTEDDLANLACLAIPVYPVFQAHEAQTVFPAVTDATEHGVTVVDQDSTDSPVALVNLVFLDNGV